MLLVAGAGLGAWAVVSFRRARTTILPWGTARMLVPGGPYRFTRNPMYLGMVLVYVGLMLLLGGLWGYLLLPVVLLVVHVGVIAREEAHLTARFGADYRAYRMRVRRWL